MLLKSAPLLREQVRDRILRMIRDTPIAAGERLLPEKEIGRRLQVNHLTVRAAMADLVALGVVRRSPGSGTFCTGVVPEASAGTQPSDPSLVAVMLYTDEHFYTEFQHHILAALQEDGFIPAVFCPAIARDRKHSPESLDRFFGWNARSLVVMQGELEDNAGFHDAFIAHADRYDRIIRLLSYPLPDDAPPYPGHHLTLDYAAAFRDAIAHFRADGRRDIAFVGGMPLDGIPCMRLRLRQAWRLYADAMFDAGLPGQVRVLAASTDEDIRREIREALGQPRPPTAFLCMDDYRGALVVEEARALGLSDPMPAIAGFFGTPWSRRYGFPSYRVRTGEVALRLRELMRRDRLREGITLAPFDRVEPGAGVGVGGRALALRFSGRSPVLPGGSR